jgi:putative ABC transport system ATP-binding protein
VLELRNATKIYSKGGRIVHAADHVSCIIQPGDLLIVHGPSGSGKSTLLLMLGGMLPPNEGRVLFDNQDIYRWSPTRRNRYRKKNVGFVFQRFFLIPYLTVFDNIRLRFILQGQSRNRTSAIQELAERFQIENRLKHRPGELSVGEQQRVAIARALVGDPAVILADEPTGNVDEENAQIIITCLLSEANKGRAVVMVTHNRQFLNMSTKQLYLTTGRVQGQRHLDGYVSAKTSSCEGRSGLKL